MPFFQYTATSPDGQPATGEIEADTVAEAVEQLLTLQLRVQSIHEILEAKVAEAAPSAEASEQRSESETILHDQMARILENGSAVAPALEAYAAELASRQERNNILAVAQQIRQGSAKTLLPGASSLPPNAQWTRLACAAAVSARPSWLVRSLISPNETDASRARTVPQMLIYPALVFFVSLALFGGFANLIAPGFHDIFESFDTELPPLTNLILRSAAVVQSFGWLWFVSISIIAAIVTWRLVFQENTVHSRHSRVGTFTESLADLIEGNVALPPAVRLAARTTGDDVVKRSAEHLATCMQQDRDPNREPYFGLPRSLVHAVSEMERPTATAGLLRELAIIYRKADRCNQSLLIVLLEPLAIISVGLFAAFVMFSLLLPLTSLISNLSG